MPQTNGMNRPHSDHDSLAPFRRRARWRRWRIYVGIGWIAVLALSVLLVLVH